MSKVDTDVRTMINNIGYIYSYSYKKFFQIVPERYINLDDLMKDLYHRIPLWDSHASVSLKRSYADMTAYTINSKGNGYIYVSRNAKIDNIYRIYREFMEKDVKTVTVNISALLRDDDPALVYMIIGPLLNADLEVKFTRKENLETHVRNSKNVETTKFKFNYDDMSLMYYNEYTDESKTIKIPLVATFPKINIIVQNFENIEILFYSNKNTTIYTYTDKGEPKSINAIVYAHENAKVYFKILPLMFVSEKRLNIKIGSIGEKYYPIV